MCIASGWMVFSVHCLYLDSVQCVLFQDWYGLLIVVTVYPLLPELSVESDPLHRVNTVCVEYGKSVCKTVAVAVHFYEQQCHSSRGCA